MKKVLSVLVLMAMVLLVGCSNERIPPGYVGKFISADGVEPELYEPGYTGYQSSWKRQIILIESASELRAAPVNVIMADHRRDEQGVSQQELGLDMDFIVNIRYRLRSEDSVITAMLKDMRLGDVSEISIKQVYNKYGNMVVGRVSREVLGQYTPEQVLGNLDTINQQLDKSVKEALADSPLLISSVSLGPIELPKVIKDRINQNKDTELSEVQKRAEQKIALLKKKNEIELARQQAVRELVDANSLSEQNKVLNESITPEVLELRRLQLREKELDVMREGLGNGNSTIFIPYGAVDNAGAQMRMFQK